MAKIVPLRMPKWGLSMQEGTIVEWHKAESSAVAEGEGLVDIETSKITNVFESPEKGTLRRVVAKPGDTLPVGALLAVFAEADTSEADIDAFIAEYQASFVPEAADAEGASALQLSTVEAGGKTLRVGRAGAGDKPPVVLIHGYSGDLNGWLFNIDALAAAGPVIALDLPGHGESTKDVGDGSLKALAEAVAAALKALDVSKAHLIGHSLGGAVAARLAADYPALRASLTVICPAAFPGTAVSEEFLTGVIEARRARDLKPVLEMLFSDPGLVNKAMIDDMAKYKRLDGVEEALTALRDRMLGPDDAKALAADLAKIPAATVIATKADRIVGSPDAAALPKTFKLVFIEGAGHMPHLEKASEVNSILLEATA